jgi:hypothetical protein
MSIRRFGHLRRTAPGNALRGPRTPLAVARFGRTPTVIYHTVERFWLLWWPCEACDGAELPLRDRASVERLLARAIADQPCPGCATRAKRLAPAGVEPTVWYDTSLSDWVVQVPCRGIREGVLLPLEIRWFDAPWVEVYLSAADIAYRSDAFHGAASEKLPEVGEDREGE